jgi:integrase
MATKTKETKQSYVKRARQLMEKAYKESTQAGNNYQSVIYKIGPFNMVVLSYVDTCLWLKKNWAPTISQATLRQYRSALKFMGSALHQKEYITKDELAKGNSILDSAHGASKEDLVPRTSATKQKSLKLKDLKTLGDELLKSKSKWGKLSYIWLYSGIFTGLRPSEWKNARIENDGTGKIDLIVKNAKNTNNRSHGEKRTINLNHLEEKQIKIIEQHLLASSQIAQKDDLWQQYYNGCANLIKYHSRRIWKNRKRYPTLYSSRHQFSANLKASGCSKVEVATLMGHASDLTAQAHYGKKIHGTRGRKPEVDENELKNIKTKDKKFVFEFEKLTQKNKQNKR